MIDIENDVFNAVATALRKKYPDIYVVGEYVKTKPKFPCVSLMEMDNSAYQRTEDSGSSANHRSVMYEANVFSNKTKGAKAECKDIAKTIDDVMLSLGFTCTMFQPFPNMNDATIYRMVGRYSGVVSKDKVIFRR